MDFQEAWEHSLRRTEIIRSRVQGLSSVSDTRIPYILLSESSINTGDTLVRKGEVTVQKPSLILPPHTPQFSGFDFKLDGFKEEALVNFLIVRGVSLPSLQYNNRTNTLDIHEGPLSGAIKQYLDLLQRKEDVHTGLLTGPEDTWQFSLLIFVCAQVARNADQDIRKLLEEYKNDNHDDH